MRYRFFAALALLFASGLVLRAEDPQPGSTKGLETAEKKVSYAIGHNLGAQFAGQGMSGIDLDALLRGIKEELDGVSSVLTQSTVESAFLEYQDKVKAEQARLVAEAPKRREEGAAFLEKNKKEEGVKVTASGLQYKVVKAGNGGAKPTAHDMVKVHYTGTLIDGTVFDSSYRRGEPAKFQVGGVIQGWQEGLKLMDVGATFMFYVPADLAYGDQRNGAKIYPGATLVFKVELLEINPKE